MIACPGSGSAGNDFGDIAGDPVGRAVERRRQDVGLAAEVPVDARGGHTHHGGNVLHTGLR